MRLVCPSCEAKYEVPEDAIPEAGRDVQCANCGHAWFQMRSRAPSVVAAPAVPEVTAPAEAPAAEPVAEPVAEPAAEPVAEPVAAEVPAEAAAVGADVKAAAADHAAPAAPDADAPVTEPVAESAALPEPEPVLASEADRPADPVVTQEAAPPAEAVAADETAAPTEAVAAAPADTPAEPLAAMPAEPPPPPAPTAPTEAAAAYSTDESVLAILREEAEREAQARQSDAAAAPAKKSGRSAASRSKKPPAHAEDVVVDAKPSARRDLLPDVEEINSTLRPSDLPEGEGDGLAMPPPAIPRNGFRAGFLTMISLAVVGAAVYTLSGVLSDLIPGLAGPLAAYVAFIDGLRLSLDGVMQSATVAINGL
jgi:predicted Zn finger-like uncharacterized protein